MPSCAVVTCKIRSSDATETNGILFHQFPTNEELREKWIFMTGRYNWQPTKDSYICSKHFRDNDYFIKRSGQRYLKNGAIPCEHVVYHNLFPDDLPVPSPDMAEEVAPVPVEEAACPDEVDNEIEDSSDSEEEETVPWDQVKGPVDLQPAFRKIKKIVSSRKRYSRKDLQSAHEKVKAATEQYVKYQHLDENEKLRIVNGLQHERPVKMTLKQLQLKRILKYVYAAMCNIEKNYALHMEAYCNGNGGQMNRSDNNNN